MKKKISIFFGLMLIFYPIYSQVTIGDDAAPQPFSLLELVSENNKGLRLPQITTILQRDAIFTNAPGFKTNPHALGLQIYNLETKCVEVWNGTDWICMREAPAVAPAWLLTGNANTNTAVNFIGTTDDQDLVFKRGGVQAGWLNYSDGNLCNTAFGVAALPTTTTGFINTAVGYSALSTNSTGSRNTAMGHFALRVNTKGDDNTAVGMKALASLDRGSYNTAIGNNAMSNSTTASSSTAVGFNALQNNTGAGNTAIGYNTLQYNTIAEYNTAVGSTALAKSTGVSNTAVGSSALGENIAGANNVAVGTKALQSNTSGNNNTVLGNSAGGTITGSDNIAIGNNSGNIMLGTSSGSFNIVIGSNATLPSASADYQLNIGNILRGTNIGTVTDWATDPGRIGIGTATPQSTLEVKGAITNTAAYNASTNLTINFALSNLAYSAATGNPTFTCTGLKDGGTYTLAWQGDQAGTATITTNMTTTKMVSSPAKTNTQHAVYTIVCIGSVAYVYPVVFN